MYHQTQEFSCGAFVPISSPGTRWDTDILDHHHAARRPLSPNRPEAVYRPLHFNESCAGFMGDLVEMIRGIATE